MSKVLKPLAIIGAIAINVIPGAGQAISAAILGSTLATTAVVTGVTVGSIFAATLSAGLLMLGAPGAPKSAGSLPDLDRLNLSQVAATPRKFVFGETALASDLRYTEPSGSQQRYVDGIICLAAHKIEALDAVYINDELAWTRGGGAQGIYAGYLTISVIKEGGAGAYHTVNGGSKWGLAQRLTGCASVKLRIDRQGANKNTASPFAAGLPSNMRFVGKGAAVYDPRRDSTKGGAGSHRADDCTTWQWADGATVLGENIALQALTWLLGWQVAGEVVCGLGLPPDAIDFDAFAVAANACDEPVALAAGGTQPRFWGGNLVPDNADPDQTRMDFALACNGRWDDSSGRLGLFVAVNDLAGALVAIGDDDILGEVQWVPFAAQPVNVVRGKNPEPGGTALYQPSDYPEVRHPGFVSGRDVERAATVDLAFVQDKRRAERIAKQVFERQQYQGRLSFRCGLRAWQLHRGDVVKFSFAQLGFAQKLFRVISWTANMDGSVDLVLIEENAAIYAWDRDESPAVAPAVPVHYDPRNAPGMAMEPVDWGDLGAFVDGIDDDFSGYDSLADVKRRWDLSGGTANFLKGNYPDYSGGALLECVGYVTAKWAELLPFDAEDLYSVEVQAWIDEPGTGCILYLGIESFDGVGVAISPQADSGSYAYVGGRLALGPGNRHSMVTLRGYFRGRAAVGAGNGVGNVAPDPGRPSPLPTGTALMRPVVLAAYNGGAPAGGSNVRLNRVRLRKVEDLTPLPPRDWVAGDVQLVGQQVRDRGRTWIARVENSNSRPPDSSTGNATWALVADKEVWSSLGNDNGQKPQDGATKNTGDGVTTSVGPGGQIGVRPGGVNSPELALGASGAANAKKFLGAPHLITAADTWGDVSIGGVQAQVTVVNTDTTAATVLLDVRASVGPNPGVPGTGGLPALRIVESGVVVGSEEQASLYAMQAAIPMAPLWIISIPASSTKTYKLQAKVSAGSHGMVGGVTMLGDLRKRI